MPYTRNTRIKVVHKKHEDVFIAQVEYRVPFAGTTWWVDFENVEPGILHLFDKEGPLPWEATWICIHSKETEDLVGLDWAKAIIDEYHKLMDEKELKDTVEYIKYP